MKYHRGNPRPGLRIWIFGMIERKSNTILLYPVSDKKKETLIPLIQRHVAPGARIFSDGWSAYCDLNSLGYEHFTVLHKYSFKKVYVSKTTDETVVCHTNEIEGAWKHAKNHFRKMSGTELSQFEGHLAEVMWRSETKGRAYTAFFELLQSVYTLEAAAEYNYTTPLFDSWRMEPETETPIADRQIVPGNTDAESEATSQSDAEQVVAQQVSRSSDDIVVPSSLPSAQVPSTSIEPLSLSQVTISSDDSAIPPNLPTAQVPCNSRMPDSLPMSQISAMFSSPGISEDEADKTIVEKTPSPPTVIPRRSTRQARKKTKQQAAASVPSFSSTRKMQKQQPLRRPHHPQQQVCVAQRTRRVKTPSRMPHQR